MKTRRIATAIAVVGLGVMLTGCELFTFSADARRKGLALYDQGNYTDAAGSFQNAVKQRPTDYQSFYYLGQTYEKLDQPQRAIQAYKAGRDGQRETMEGIQDTAFREKILDALAGSIAKSSDREREITILRERAAVARNGEDLITIARVFKFAGDPDTAIATYSEVTAKYPREQNYALEYGLYLTKLNLKDKAREVLTAASKIKPNNDVDAALKAVE